MVPLNATAQLGGPVSGDGDYEGVFAADDFSQEGPYSLWTMNSALEGVGSSRVLLRQALCAAPAAPPGAPCSCPTRRCRPPLPRHAAWAANAGLDNLWVVIANEASLPGYKSTILAGPLKHYEPEGEH